MINTLGQAAAACDAVTTAYRAFDHPMIGAAGQRATRSRERGADEGNPDNELHARGCDLVEAAAAIGRAADATEAVRAIPAVLGCIGAALRELTEASAGLRPRQIRRFAIDSQPGRRAPPRQGQTVCIAATRTSGRPCEMRKARRPRHAHSRATPLNTSETTRSERARRWPREPNRSAASPFVAALSALSRPRMGQ